MLNTVYRLTMPKQIEAVTFDEPVDEHSVIVRPTYLSICHADQRYFTGARDKKVLEKKLPMALVHEGIGVVIADHTGTLPAGTRVAIVPNTPVEHDDVIAPNYLPSSKFRSSGFDGLTQEYIVTNPEQLVALPETLSNHVGAFTELISVAMHAITKLSASMDAHQESLGIWGDGNLGYIAANLVKVLYPNTKLYIFGKHEDKLNFFSFADATYRIDEIPESLEISNAIEAVGGKGSEDAVNQIIDHIMPMGAFALMGVSEKPIAINTRKVLEKGLTISASSRSSRVDFEKTIAFLNEHDLVQKRLKNLVDGSKPVHNVKDIVNCFEEDLIQSWGKSVLKWEI